MGVQKTINCLRRLLEFQSIVYRGDGLLEKISCTFNPPLDSSLIETFEKEINCKLPEDYKKFLLICDGLTKKFTTPLAVPIGFPIISELPMTLIILDDISFL